MCSDKGLNYNVIESNYLAYFPVFLLNITRSFFFGGIYTIDYFQLLFLLTFHKLFPRMLLLHMFQKL